MTISESTYGLGLSFFAEFFFGRKPDVGQGVVVVHVDLQEQQPTYLSQPNFQLSMAPAFNNWTIVGQENGEQRLKPNCQFVDKCL